MAIVNPLLNVKDSRWLQLEVCREFQRNKCSRSDTECKFAHPGPNVEIQNGRVVACYDSIKGRCNREKPPCKYFHPPKHLKEQLIINGKNHLALKNALLHQVPFPTAAVLAGQLPMVGRVSNLLNAYPRNYQLQQPTPPQTCLINPMAAAFASALNNNGTAAPPPPPTALISNSRITKAPNPYLTNLSAIAAASSAAYGAYSSNPNSAAAAAAAAMMMGAPDHHHHHHHSHTHPHQPHSYQFNSYGLAIPNSSPSNTVSSVAAAAAAAAQAAANINNLNTKVRSAPTSTTLAVPETNGANNVANSAVAAPSGTVSLESHSGLAEASSINAVANTAAAAAAAAAAIGRKRTRESNDELLMHISGAYPITKRVAMEKDGTPLYQAPQATATAYAHPQSFAVHQPLVPLSFYFPLISQANTIPRY